LGKTGGTLDVCADISFDVADPDTSLCFLGTINLIREKGQSKFVKVAPETLFDASNQDVFWSVDTNSDFRIAQFRVYQVS
jgi:hypothetical protein